MKKLYQAANTLEAHMIVGMLEQQGIDARIDGEYLQGGAGELQAMNLVQIMVEEADYPAAKAIVDDWDARQPSLTVEQTQKSSALANTVIAAISGFILGVVLTVWACVAS